MMPSTGTLQKKIGFWSASSIIVGSVIGSGVFMKPATMAAQLGSPIWMAIVWVIAGLFSLFGALIYAELGAMIPETGGIYAYFRRMFGDFVAFLYGWAAFSVINTAAVAAISYVCAKYADYFLHLPTLSAEVINANVWHIPFIGDLYPLADIGVKSLAVLLVLALTFLNYLSVNASNAFQVVSTFLKMAVIAAVIFGIFFSGHGSLRNLTDSLQPIEGRSLFNGIIIAMTGAFFAYDGWVNITFVAGEIKNPQRNIPRSLITGMIACMAIYLLVNEAYLYVLPVEQMAKSSLVASDAVGIALGTMSEAIVAAMIVICTLGSVNGNLMATCRVTYAMGQDRAFPAWTGKTHPRHLTPGNALWLHAIWTCLFIVTGSFDMLTDMFIFVTWIAYGAGAVGIFLLRKRLPDMERPYKMWGYPVVPIVFICFTGFYLVMTVYNDVTNYLNDRQPIINSVLGIVLTAIGIPLYFYFKKKPVS